MKIFRKTNKHFDHSKEDKTKHTYLAGYQFQNQYDHLNLNVIIYDNNIFIKILRVVLHKF